MKLSDIKDTECGYVSSISGSLAFRTRLEEMGFVKGERVTRMFSSPVSSPVIYAVMGEKVALRTSEAERIEITEHPLTLDEEAADEAATPVSPQGPTCHDAAEAHEAGKRIGRHDGGCASTPEGCGGCASCGTQRTVAPKQADELTIALVGNPNCGKTAFFNAASGGHERTGNYAGVTVTSVVGQLNFEGRKLRIVDLPGTYSLRAFSPDEAYVAHELEKGEVDVIINVLDATNLERNLLLTLQLKNFGIPMVGVLNMYDEFEGSESRLDRDELSRRLGMPLLPTVAHRGRGVKNVLRAAVEAAATPSTLTEHSLADVRRGASNYEMHRRIRALLADVYERREGRLGRLTAAWDKYLVRRAVAYPLFLIILWFIFQATFVVGQYPMDWIDAGVAWLQNRANDLLPASALRDLIVSGILGGVGAVIVFFPNILILYFLISLLEDSGYLARAATLADPLLSRAGLHGKSFIPMLMGFGCNVPAVMATRTIESRKSRLLTMAVIPFMSCSARIPVYLIFAGAFFPQHAGLVMFCLYMGGIVVAFLSAIVLSKFVHRKGDSHFIMEIPPYRRPMLKSVFRHTWERGREYLRKMASVILMASIVIWALSYVKVSNPFHTEAQPAAEASLLEIAGQGLSPVFEPLGYNWQMTAGIVTGVSAKELLVSTLGVLYNIPEDAANEDAAVASIDEGKSTHLAARIQEEGTTPASALSFLVFALLYIPCIATVAALKNESGRWKFALATSAYTFALAYTLAFLVYRVALLW